MATTVDPFSAIDDNEVDAESPITESLMTRMRDNSYWIDPASTRTTATSNTLVLTPDQTAGTTQWQEIGDLGVIDGTKGTITAFTTSFTTITTLQTGYLFFDFHFYNTNTASASVKVDLSDDTFVSSYMNSGSGTNTGVASGTIPASSIDVAVITNSGGGDVRLQMQRNSGTDILGIRLSSGSITAGLNWMIL
jgi:hypothetical protein